MPLGHHRRLCLTRALFILSLALAGCADLGTGGAAPAADSVVAAPSAWTRTDPALSTRAVATETLAAWWQQFADAQLDTLIRNALTAAPDVRSAQALLRQARANRDLAQANLLPTVTATGGATRTRGVGVVPSTLYNAGFDASWEPSLFGGLSDAARGAQADLAAAEASLDSARATLAGEVALNYITLRSAQQRLAIAHDNLDSQRATLQLVTWKAQAGLASALDVEQARTNVEQTRASLPALETTLSEAENHLALLSGLPAGALRDELATSRPLPVAPAGIAVGIPADTLRQRPDIRAAEATLRAEQARSAERAADRYPSLSLSGSFGWQTVAATLGGGSGVASTLAGSLAATLFDGGRIEARLAGQRAVEEQARIAYEKSLLSACEDVENALTAYAVGRQRSDAWQQASSAARQANQLARTLYQAGAADFQRVLDTDRTRLSAEDGLASAQADLLTAVIRLYKALGGGWQHAAPGADAST